MYMRRCLKFHILLEQYYATFAFGCPTLLALALFGVIRVELFQTRVFQNQKRHRFYSSHYICTNIFKERKLSPYDTCVFRVGCKNK